MFGLFSKKTNEKVAGSKTEKIKLSGLHCTSCSLNIDGALEDTSGVLSATTSYAKSETVVTYDPTQIESQKLKAVIVSLGYAIVE